MLTTNELIAFEPLRDKCLRHLQSATSLCIGGFVNPDRDFLNEEYSVFSQDLRRQKFASHPQDLVNAFWSAVFELEHHQKLYPNSLIVIRNRLCRIINFRCKYPVEIEYRVFTKYRNGRLKTIIYSTILNKPIQRVLLIDPLTKYEHT
ncbi:hypothetical protein [Nostoc sp. WHI]|uniref:hypothetical protein n=1 Tax=Nostoc sp. WHI TaxID=2650611 RepID=UPI0018C7665B|nr:hypothetical protein [Nostoc sp. WHI]MBG1268740.1 hypothetical protein [Nostoc sp. WHI]